MIGRLLAWPFVIVAFMMCCIAWLLSNHENEDFETWYKRVMNL